MNNVYGYIRVSRKEQEQGASLSEQKRILTEYAKTNNLKIIHFYEETKTAAKRGRPFFTEMMTNLKQGKASGVIIHKIDRSARNLHDWASIGDLIDNNIQVYFAHESLNLNERGGRLSADIQAVMASDYVRNLRQEIVKGIQGRLLQGLYPWKAPLGYEDNGTGKLKTIHPQQGKLIQELFKLYASKEYNIITLSKKMESLGLTNSKGNRVCKNGITRILNNPFYIGIIKVNNETYEGKHEPLISPELFKKVKLILKYRQKNKGIKHHYLFRKMLQCKECEYFMPGERQKGIVYYRCQTKDCLTKSIREDHVEKYVENMLKTIMLTKKETAQIKDILNEQEKNTVGLKTNLLKKHKFQLGKLETKEKKLLDGYLDSTIDKESYTKMKEEILVTKKEIQEKEHAISAENTDMLSGIEEILELCNRPLNIYKSGIIEEKREYLKNITSNLLISGKSIYFSMLSPYQELAFRDIFSKCGDSHDTSRTMTSQISYTDKNTSGIQPKALTKKQMKNFIDYLLNNPQQ